MLFLKPTSSYVTQGNPIVVSVSSLPTYAGFTHDMYVPLQIPPRCTELHYEVELGVVIGKEGRDIPQSEAHSHIAGYALALDMTARNLQSEAKKKGHPWSVAKGYDTFCPVSPFILPDQVDSGSCILWLRVDGQEKQRGCTSDMVFPVAQLLSFISSIFTLEPCDLILTGTPEGVGPVVVGQTITAGIDDLLEVSFPVVAKE